MQEHSLTAEKLDPSVLTYKSPTYPIRRASILHQLGLQKALD